MAYCYCDEADQHPHRLSDSLQTPSLQLRSSPSVYYGVSENTLNCQFQVATSRLLMEKKPYGTFRLGRRGRRGRIRLDQRWIADSRNRSRFRESSHNLGNTNTIGPTKSLTHGANTGQSSGAMQTSDSVRLELIEEHNYSALREEEVIEDLLNDSVNPEEPAPEDTDSDDSVILENPDGEYVLPEGDSDNVPPLHDRSDGLGERPFPMDLSKLFKNLCCWQNIFALLLLNGTGRLSVHQYNVVQAVMNLFIKLGLSADTALPASSTIKRTVLPLLKQWGFVESDLRTAAIDVNKRGAPRSSGESGPDAAKEGSFIVVVPSAWSRMDVSLKQTWRILKAAGSNRSSIPVDPVFSSVHSIPMVSDQDRILDVAHAIEPTTLGSSVQETTPLLSKRCSFPFISVRIPEYHPFPGHILSDLDTAICDRGIQIRFVCVKSVVVPSQPEELSPAQYTEGLQRRQLVGGEFTALRTPIPKLWMAGDVCTLTKVNPLAKNVFIVVQQHVRRLGEPQQMELVCIPISDDSETDGSCLILFRVATVATISSISMVESPDLSQHLPRYVEVPSFGRLQDGRLFFVDHILLYSDGFTQYNFKQGSAGGVYALSLNYPMDMRRSRERVRVLAITPPGVSTMEGLRAIIDDIVKSSTEGDQVQNADGEDMVLYTNMVGYVADYHETGHALDVTGQNGKAPCHLCTFLRYQGHPSTASQYAYSTVIHSSDTSYARMGMRTEAVRASPLYDNGFVDIGLNPPEQARKKNSPLHELSMKLRDAVKRVNIPLTTRNVPVVKPQFDPYRSVLVSPDHVLFGVACNALNFSFAVLPSKARRVEVDAMISTAVRRNGLAKETSIYNLKESSLHAASISTRFSTLLVSPEIFKETFDNCQCSEEITNDMNSPCMRSLEIITKLRDLVSATYWFPSTSIDDTSCINYFNRNGGRSHLRRLENLFGDYVNVINDTCKAIPEARAKLDKPNVHRVLELYKHSIPAMGHVRYFAELVFETAHQSLKRAMQRSNFRESHVQSSWTCIVDDWKRRLECVINPEAENLEEDEWERERELLKLMFGRRDDVINAMKNEPALMTHVSSILQNKPLKTLLNSKQSRLSNISCSSKWVLSKPYDSSHSDLEMLNVLTKAKEMANNLLVDEGCKKVKAFRRAGRVQLLPSGERLRGSKLKSYDILQRDAVLRAQIEDEHAPVLNPTHGEEQEGSFLMYFVVIALINFSASGSGVDDIFPTSYAVVRKCVRSEDDLLHVDPSAPVQLIALGQCVRRVGLVHACHNDSKLSCFSSSSMPFTCNATVLGGHRFYYYDRDRGYPPRMA